MHAEVAKETGAAKIANLASMDIDRILDQCQSCSHCRGVSSWLT